MKQIKVYLQYPWKFPDSSYYNYLLKYPPSNVEYINARKEQFKVMTSPHRIKLTSSIKKFLRFALGTIKIPNITYTRPTCDVIHCAHCLSLNKKPWIVDTEHYWNFTASERIVYSDAGKRFVKKMLNRNYCKKILPWTETAKKTITNALRDKKIEEKIEVVYPAIPTPNMNKIKHNEINLLFIGRAFNNKGGFETGKAFDILTKKYDDVNGIIVSEVPGEIKKEYSNNKRIKFYDLIPQDKLFKEIYPKADIFVYPGYSDSFGFALVEAMSFGLPIVTVDGFARKEIVGPKNGFVIKNPGTRWQKDKLIVDSREKITNELILRTKELIENKGLRIRMGKNGFREIDEGKFSVKERNKKLGRIYEDALK